MANENRSSDESPDTNPCCPIDGPRCPDYWRCFNAIDRGDPESVRDRKCVGNPKLHEEALCE